MCSNYIGFRWLMLVAVSFSTISAGEVFANDEADSPLIEVRLGPPQQVVANAMGIARQVRPGFQTELVPALLLGSFGYPQFADFDATAPIVLCGFADDSVDGGLRWVGAAQLREGSEAMRWLRVRGMTVERAGDWVLFFTGQPGRGERQLVLARADKVEAGDVSWTISPQRLAVEEMRERMLMALRLKSGGGQQAEMIDPAVDLMLDILSGLDSLTMSLDLAGGAIELGFRVKPGTGTLFDGVVDAPLSTADDGSAFINAGSFLEFRGRYPDGMWAGLMSWMLEAGAGFPWFAEWLNADTRATLVELGERFDGTGSGAVTYAADGSLANANITYAADYTFDDLVAWGEWMASIDPSGAPFTGGGGKQGYSVEVTTGEIDGLKYLRTESEIRRRFLLVSPADYLAATEAIRSGQKDPQMLEAFGEVIEESDSPVTYQAVVNGAVVVAGSSRDLADFVRRMRDGKTNENSLRAHLPMATGDVFLMHINPALMPVAESVHNPTPSVERIIRQFRARKHDPIRLRLRMDDRLLTGSVTLPVSSLSAISRLRSTIDQSQQAEAAGSIRIPF